MLIHSIRKTLGAYFFLLDGKVDAVTFTAGIGEHDELVREDVVKNLESVGLVLDKEANLKRASGARTISAPESKVKILVIPTNEELQIAQVAQELVSKK